MVVDPQRDVDRVEKILADRGVRCAMVVETHIHNDYVTGGYDLAMRHGCPYVVNATDDVSRWRPNSAPSTPRRRSPDSSSLPTAKWSASQRRSSCSSMQRSATMPNRSSSGH